MDKETLKKSHELNREEFIEHLKNRPMPKYFRLNYSHERIVSLVDFVKLIENYKHKLKYKGNKDFSDKDSKFSPSEVLNDYILLEADCFFQYAKKCIERKDSNMPKKLPNYCDFLHIFRNKIGAHRDIDEVFPTIVSWINFHEKMDKEIGGDMTIVVNDVKSFYKKFKRKLSQNSRRKKVRL